MNQKEKVMLTELRSMMETPGWTHLVNGWKAEQEALPLMAFTHVKTMEELQALRVRNDLLSQLIGLEEDIASALEAGVEESTDES